MAGTRGARAAGALALATLTAACSLGEKQDQADRIIASVDRLADAGPMAGQAHIDFRVESLPGPQPGGNATRAPGLAYALIVDVEGEKAELRPAPDADPLVVFAGDRVFARRSGGGSSRAWAALDFGDLDRVEKPTLDQAMAGAAAGTPGLIDPNLVVGLVAGTLAGSIEAKGDDPLGERRTERFTVNLSVDKAESELELTEPERDVRRRMLTAIGVSDDVLPADVWLDARGDLRQVEIRFPLRPAPRVKLVTTYRVRLDDDAAAPRVPGRRSVLTVESPSELLRGLLSTAKAPQI